MSHRCAAPGLLTLTAATERVLAACRAAGGQPLIVGGSVRDALHEGAHQPKDVDIEVHGLTGYEPLSRELGKLGSVDLFGVSFGVLKLTVDGEDFDVSLPRRDSKTGDGHTGFDVEVDPTLDEVAAFGRRDFTVNAIGYDTAAGELVDPYAGIADLHDRVLRHTTAAFSEDPLRVLRAVQFAARFDMTLAPETADLAASIHDEFPHIAKERVWQEFRKLARVGVTPSRGLDVLVQTGWITWFPALNDTRGIQQDSTWHPEGDVFTHLSLAADEAVDAAARYELDAEARERVVLGAMLHDLGKVTDTQFHDDGRITSHGHAESGAPVVHDFLLSIGAPVQTAEWVSTVVQFHMRTAANQGTKPSAYAVRKLARALGDVPFREWAAVVDADQAGRGPGAKISPAAQWLDVYENGNGRPRISILRGEHLMSRGMAPGKEFKPILAASVEAQDAGEFTDEAGAVAWLDKHLAELS
ncbi:hypothetical protein ASF30_09365 [Leifsonia sp. Leaf264]|nr:hypothetical protein ASF30_09365 [Leifsonia sp. Leaf264]